MRESTAILPMRRPRSISVAITSGAVRAPRTTSSSFMTWAGLKKCAPTTSCGREVTAAMASTSSPEVLVARIAPGLQWASSWRKMSCFRPMSSNTASITMSASFTSAICSEPVISARRWSMSAWLSLPRLTVVA